MAAGSPAAAVDDVLLNGKNEWVEPWSNAHSSGSLLWPGCASAGSTDAYRRPHEVRAAFDNVAKAQTGIRTQLNKAEQERDNALRTAAGAKFRKEQETAAYVRNRTTLAFAEASRFRERAAQYTEGCKYNPNYLRQIWEEERGKLFAKLKENGQISLLDDHLVANGLDFTIRRRCQKNHEKGRSMTAVVTLIRGPAGNGKTGDLLNRFRQCTVARPGSTLWLGHAVRRGGSARYRLLVGSGTLWGAMPAHVRRLF